MVKQDLQEMNKSNWENIPVSLLLSVLSVTALLLMRDILGISVNKMFFVLIVVGACLFMNYRSIIALLFFLMPVLNGLPGNYILPVVALALFIKQPTLMSRNGYVFFTLLALFEIVHYPFYSFSTDIPLTIGYLSVLFLMCYTISIKDGSLDYKQCLLFFCMGNVVFLLIILGISSAHGGSVASFVAEGYRIGETKDLAEPMEGQLMINANPNGLGAFAITGAAIVLVLYKARRISALILSVFLAVFILVGTLSFSRTFFLCLALLLFLVVVVKGGEKKLRKRLPSIFALVIIVGALLFFLFSNELIYNVIYNRFAGDDMSTGNGRTEIMLMYHNWLSQHPICFLFGTGAVHYQDVVNLPSACHNAIQQIVVSYGIVGLFLFAVLVVSAIKYSYNKFFLYLIPFIVVFISVQASRILNPWNNLYLFFAVFYVMKVGQKTPNNI